MKNMNLKIIGKWKAKIGRAGGYIAMASSLIIVADNAVRYGRNYIEIPFLGWIGIGFIFMIIIQFFDKKFRIIDGETEYPVRSTPYFIKLEKDVEEIKQLLKERIKE